MDFAPLINDSYKYVVARQPLVTALINTYNYARYLPFAINSVLRQTYPNIEIIVVDDGSTDHSQEVLEPYRNRVQIIRTQNGGQGQAFNIGIGKASGDLIMLLDADDIWVPQKVQLMVDLAAKNPTAAMLYHRYQNIDRQGRFDGQPQPFSLINGNYRAEYLRSGGSWWSPIASVLTLRTEHIRRALPLPTYAVREGADTIIADYCILTSDVFSLPDALTLRRVHGANLYATGRADFVYRSRAIRESDIRRIEWRMFLMQRMMRYLGDPIRLDVNQNEWRLINMYILGRVTFGRLAKALLLAREYDLKSRFARLKLVVAAKRMQRNAESRPA
jgi:glycosyltransferase involved in cell wall biosynthesis